MLKNYFPAIATALVMAFVPMSSDAQSGKVPPHSIRATGPAVVKSVTVKGSTSRSVMKPLKNASMQKEADLSRFSGRTFWGSLINSTLWNNLSSAKVPYGIYSFVLNDDPTPTAHLTHLNYDFLSGANGRGKFYGITALSLLGTLTGSRYITLDTKNWKELYSKVHSTEDEGKSYSLLASTMAYNPIDDKIYAFQYNDDLTGLYWSEYDKENNALKEIASFRGNYNILTLASDPTGTMYFINDSGDLYSINKTNGRATLIGSTGVTPTMYTQSMMYDGNTGSFVWAAQTAEGSELYTVNPSTAETSKILSFNHSEEFSSLYSEENGAVDGAPAAAQNLKLTYDQDGGLTGNITFTAPEQTYDGNSLGQSTLNVWLDGTNLKGTETNAGEQVTIPVTLTEGNHYIAVNLNNDNGYSPLSYVYQYAGYDTPEKSKEIIFVSNKTAGKDTVTWAPTDSGVNAGYIDKANLKYTLVRMPDSVTVASNYTQTQFVEDIPATMHNYSYRVYGINNGKTSEYAESNKIICGNSFTVPYSQNFENSSTFTDFFTIIDGNQDGNTWRNGYQEARIDISKYTKNGDDWLITPAITLKSGNKYRFTANIRTYSNANPEKFKILIGTNPKDTSTFKVISQEDHYESYQDFSAYNSDFSVAKDSDYYMAIYYDGDTAQNSCMIRLKSVALSKVGANGSPTSVSNLTVTPDVNDSLAATISFIAPTKDLDGNDLASISKIDILRNKDVVPVHTIENPSPGASLSWKDTDVPKTGLTSYTVIASNTNGEGQSISDSAFVGVYTAPYTENFDTKAAFGLYSVKYKGVATQNNYGWSYGNQCLQYTSFVTGDSISDAWLFTPAIRLDADGVYKVSFKANVDVYSTSITNKVYAGNAATPEGQTLLLGALPSHTYYAYQTLSGQLITTQSGKYYIGFNSIASNLWDYASLSLDSITVTYVKSAKSPYQITNYVAKADTSGALKANLSFNAPSEDYQGQPLSDLSKIEIYRAESSIPVKTFTSPEPGAEISWEDDQPIHGQNHYIIVATNSYGRGEAFLDTLYVGKDVPEAVSQYTLTGDDDNINGILTWEAPEKGKHGGVIVPSELTYNVYQYNATNSTYTLIGSDIKTNTFTVQHDAGAQQVFYYAVAPVNTEGTGDTLVHSVVLGQLYQMPFKESFANDSLSTNPWLINTDNSNMLTWGVTNPSGTYNDATPQDSDGGCAYIYNGSYYAYYAGAGFLSPKMNLGGNSQLLTFWVYNVKTNYTNAKPSVVVKVSSMDGSLEQLGDTLIVGGDAEDGWKNYTLSLDKYNDSKYIYLCFEAYTDGYADVVYLDNIMVGNETETGINGIGANGKSIRLVNYYDLSGKEVIIPRKGVFIKTTTYEDGTKESRKVVMK